MAIVITLSQLFDQLFCYSPTNLPPPFSSALGHWTMTQGTHPRLCNVEFRQLWLQPITRQLKDSAAAAWRTLPSLYVELQEFVLGKHIIWLGWAGMTHWQLHR